MSADETREEALERIAAGVCEYHREFDHDCGYCTAIADALKDYAVVVEREQAAEIACLTQRVAELERQLAHVQADKLAMASALARVLQSCRQGSDDDWELLMRLKQQAAVTPVK